MFIFQSMTNISIATTVVVLLFLMVSTRRSPLAAVTAIASNLLKSRSYLFHFAALLGILYVNKLEMKVESQFPVVYDFAALFHQIEGNFVYWIQHTFMNPSLTYVLTFMYVIVFPALMITSLCIYTTTQNYRLFYATCIAIMMNYLVAIPFYLFVPVNEVWFYHPQVDFLIPSIFPSFETDYRPLSGLNNCFPSLHTSISVTVALLAYHSGNRIWKWITGISAAVIVFSIFYLGIHWLTDMIGGVLLAIAASTVGLKLAARSETVGSMNLMQRVPSRQKMSGQ
ncbi:phosphatase PAP2 family protein [Paenibacillus gansuensis]|uniref:Phosphatase PAP2 family protein n=1 Tax=Paenibacillus gansuensis TaxID=306542 RepID=A0ABW5PDB7_9BACL